MLQLNPPIPLNTPKGEGFAHLVIDYGPESDLYWTVLITETGEIWTYANKYVRASKNITLGRTQPAAPPPDGQDAQASAAAAVNQVMARGSSAAI